VLGDPSMTLRLPGEPVRHKVLDLLGDLFLLGADLRAHVIATRSGTRRTRSSSAASTT
jgi:UDP-3-O-acyl-N-acetylglucosamine deacetylase